MQLNSSGYALMSNIAEEHLRALIEGERVNKLAIVLPPLVKREETMSPRRRPISGVHCQIGLLLFISKGEDNGKWQWWA